MRNTNRFRALALVALAFTAVGIPRAVAQEATLNSLSRAWNSELNAALHYNAFARAALNEGYPRISALFCAIAKAESIHAGNHQVRIDALRGGPARAIESVVVRSTRKNLERAIELERGEWRTVYPLFAEIARKDFQPDARESFRWAGSAEKSHADVFAAALDGLRNTAPGSKLLVSLEPVALPGPTEPPCPTARICPGCGTAFATVPGKSCPNCGTSCSQLLEPRCGW